MGKFLVAPPNTKVVCDCSVFCRQEQMVLLVKLYGAIPNHHIANCISYKLRCVPTIFCVVLAVADGSTLTVQSHIPVSKHIYCFSPSGCKGAVELLLHNYCGFHVSYGLGCHIPQTMPFFRNSMRIWAEVRIVRPW